MLFKRRNQYPSQLHINSNSCILLEESLQDLPEFSGYSDEKSEEDPGAVSQNDEFFKTFENDTDSSTKPKLKYWFTKQFKDIKNEFLQNAWGICALSLFFLLVWLDVNKLTYWIPLTATEDAYPVQSFIYRFSQVFLSEIGWGIFAGSFIVCVVSGFVAHYRLIKHRLPFIIEGASAAMMGGVLLLSLFVAIMGSLSEINVYSFILAFILVLSIIFLPFKSKATSEPSEPTNPIKDYVAILIALLAMVLAIPCD